MTYREMMTERKCKTYCCKYFHDGSWWGTEITAYDDEDAARRVAKLGNMHLLGELKMTIPCNRPLSGYLVMGICWIQNRFRKNR